MPHWLVKHLYTQNERLSKRRQKRCQSDNFMVVTKKVVKVVSIYNQNVVIMTTQIWYQVDWSLVVKVINWTTLTIVKLSQLSLWQLWRHKVVKSCQSENSDNNGVVTSQQPKVVIGTTLTTLTTKKLSICRPLTMLTTVLDNLLTTIWQHMVSVNVGQFSYATQYKPLMAIISGFLSEL